MRIGELFEAIDAHQKEIDADRRHIGNLVRGATLNICNHQRAKEDRISDPVKFWPMPWDPVPEDEVAAAVQDLQNMSAEDRRKAALDFINKTGGLNGK